MCNDSADLRYVRFGEEVRVRGGPGLSWRVGCYGLSCITGVGAALGVSKLEGGVLDAKFKKRYL